MIYSHDGANAKAGADFFECLVPARELIRHEFAKCFRRRALHSDAGLDQARGNGRLLDALVQYLVKLGDDVRRRAARGEEAVPRGHVIARQQPRLGCRRHIRHDWKPFLASDGDRLELTGLHLAEHGEHRVEQHVDLLAEYRRDCLG